jgi:hypothetical protein
LSFSREFELNKLAATAVFSAVCALSACQTTGTRITHLYTGNSQTEVRETLGRPDAVRVLGDFEIYTYLARHHSRLSFHHTDYTVVMKDGKVVQFGPGVAQREGLHTVVIVPARS